MAWAAGLTNCENLEKLCRKYSDSFEKKHSDNSEFYYLLNMVEGRKYHIEISPYSRAEGYNTLVRVYGPYPNIVNKTIKDLRIK